MVGRGALCPHLHAVLVHIQSDGQFAGLRTVWGKEAKEMRGVASASLRHRRPPVTCNA